MKRLVLMVVAAAMMCSLAGCSSKCKESGCDDKAEKNGYCATHYALHELEKLFIHGAGDISFLRTDDRRTFYDRTDRDVTKMDR